MTSSVSEGKHSGVEQIDYWSSHPINWPALYTIWGLGLTIAGVNLWFGSYDSAAMLALILTGSALLVYDRVLKRLGNETWHWRWAGLGVYGLAGCLGVAEVAQAWLTHGG